MMDRRQFLALAAAAAMPRTEPGVTAARLPRWRGFNLLEKFTAGRNAPFRETDFAWIAEWGFDFVRLPLSYLCWSEAHDWRRLREPVLAQIDQAVEWGGRYRVHVCLNFHRAPGYCVNPPAEPHSLWKDGEALKACAFHWAHFARRYRGVPSSRLSFNLLNEPARIDEPTYARVVGALVEAIREHDGGRLIIADGLEWGRRPVDALVKLGIAQSTRGYEPMAISHYKATWVRGSDGWPVPTWPLKDGRRAVGREELRRERIEPWLLLQRRGVGVHVGEWGAHRFTPHQVVLAWMRDSLGLWKEAGWGWALWNLRGTFGVLDSQRGDVAYADFHGHKLDRAMLELLRAG